jgi:hypothetical protein
MSRRRSANHRNPAAQPSEPGRNPSEPRRYRWKLRLGLILLAAGLGWAAWALTHRSKSGLTIENRSGQTIATVKVIMLGKTTTYENVAPGTTWTIPFPTETVNEHSAIWAASAWAFPPQGLGPLAIGAGPAPVVADASAAAAIRHDDFFRVVVVSSGGKLSTFMGKIGENITLDIQPGGNIQRKER